MKVCLAQETEWHPFGSWVKKPGQSRWLGCGWLTESEIYPVNLLVLWEKGEDEPWCLVTNLPDRRMTLKAYARRIWIEEMFCDMNLSLICLAYLYLIPQNNTDLTKMQSLNFSCSVTRKHVKSSVSKV